MGRSEGKGRSGLSKVDRFGGSPMTAVTPTSKKLSDEEKSQMAKATQSKPTNRKAAQPSKPARSAKGSNRTQNRTASRHKVTAKE